MDAQTAPTEDQPPAAEAETLPVVVAQRVQARSLYWRGWSITQIAAELALPYTTISSWKSRHR